MPLTNAQLAESRSLLQQSALKERWQASFSQPTFYIGETSFGSGLNFLAAWQLWEDVAAQDKQLHYIAVENQALSRADLAQALGLWPEFADFSRALLAVYPQQATAGFHQFVFAQRRVTLTLVIAEPAAGLRQLLMSDHPLHHKPFHPGMDAWLIDRPLAINEAAKGQSALFDVMAALSRDHCSLATCKANASMQDALCRAGFRIEEQPGKQANKLTARFIGVAKPEAAGFSADTRQSPYPTPWHVVSERQKLTNPSVTVIGAGLAGSHSARALAERGWRVRVLETAASIASGASGNAQGIVYGKLSSDSDGLAAFNLASLLYAQRFYRTYWRQDSSIGEQCGLLQLAFDSKQLAIRGKLQTNFADADDFLRFVSAEQASKIAGVAVESPGMYFPQLGWLKPAQLCRQLLDHPNITVQCNTAVAALEFSESVGNWQLLGPAGQIIAQTPKVIIANAHHALDFPQTRQLPLKPIRGQVSEFPGERIPLKTVLCGEGYIAPASAGGEEAGRQSFGASYTLHEQRPDVLMEDHRQNLANLSACLPALAPTFRDLDPDSLSGRTAFRCTTLDYLPLVGPVPDYSQFVRDFQRLGKNAKAGIPKAGPYLPGLYLNVGHGSRGLAYTALAAELLAAQMNHDPLPVTRDLATALNPARFIIRDLIRKRLTP